MISKVSGLLASVWDISGFQQDELRAYSLNRMLTETRRGLALMCTIFTVAMLLQVLFYYTKGENSFAYTSILLAALSAHIALTCNSLKDLKSVHMLGITLLVVSGTAFILLAQQSKSLDTALFASISLLFMVIPLVPWGLREGSWIIGLIYLTFTISIWGTMDQFDFSSLVSLQFMLVGAGLTSLVLVARNTGIRKKDVESRYQLENAHAKIMMLSNKDPLTGSWNRRFFSEQFPFELNQRLQKGQRNYFAFIDVDDFKKLNDTYGHTFGDRVLKSMVNCLREAIGSSGMIVRLGGDEFALFFVNTSPEDMFKRVQINMHSELNASIGLSVGVVEVDADNTPDINSLYKLADQRMYAAKDRKGLQKGNNLQIVLSDEPGQGKTRSLHKHVAKNPEEAPF